MSGLTYAGRPAANPNDITNRLVVNTILSSATPNQASVQAQLTALTSGATPTYAPKTYVDTQDTAFQAPAYYQSQDLLNVRTASRGTINQVSGANTPITGSYYGVAGLDSAGHVPVAQMPVLGAGYVLGPYGLTAQFSGSTSNTPMKICDFNIGVPNLSFRPLVFMQVFVSGLMAHPVIEVRIANSTTAVGYSASTLVAQGVGRGLYNDYASIVVLPCPDATGQTPSLLATTYNLWASAWLYDLNSQSVTIADGNIASAACLLLRGAQ